MTLLCLCLGPPAMGEWAVFVGRLFGVKWPRTPVLTGVLLETSSESVVTSDSVQLSHLFKSQYSPRSLTHSTCRLNCDSTFDPFSLSLYATYSTTLSTQRGQMGITDLCGHLSLWVCLSHCLWDWVSVMSVRLSVYVFPCLPFPSVHSCSSAEV